MIATSLPGLLTLSGDIDDVSLQFSDDAQFAVKILVAVFLFGIALDTKVSDFAPVVRRPWIVLTGLFAQWGLLPAATLVLTLLLDVQGSVAVGMILVACCPAGNLSNLLTHRVRGDIALSVSMTAASVALSALVTPFALAFWAGRNDKADALLTRIHLDPVEMFIEVTLLLTVPFALGVLVATKWPGISAPARRIVEPTAFVVVLALVTAALVTQREIYGFYLAGVIVAIAAQNITALSIGYGTGRALGLTTGGVRAMTFEVGIRNTALALVLALAFTSELAGVAVVASLWGMFDIATGLLLAAYWRRRTPAAETVPAPRPDRQDVA